MMKLHRSASSRPTEMQARIAELEEERFRLRFRGATETLDDPLRLRVIRRDIARLKTVLREGTSRPRPAPHAPVGDSHGDGNMRTRRRHDAKPPDRNARKTRTGIVVSDKMQKTVVVAIERRVRAPGLRQDDDADEAPEGARRGELGEDGRHRAHRGDPSAVEGQAVARGRDRRSRALRRIRQ